MGYRSDMDSATGLVDTMIGSAYPVVREVATNIEYVKHVSAHLEYIVGIEDNIEEINKVGANIEEIIIVSNNMDAITSVNENMDSIITINNDIEEVKEVADNIPEIYTAVDTIITKTEEADALLDEAEELANAISGIASPLIIADNLFGTKGSVELWNPATPPDYIRIAGHLVAGDGGAALYKKVASQPAHAGKIQSMNGTWWELSEERITPYMFGAKGDNVTDDVVALQAFFDYATAYKKVELHCIGSFKIGAKLFIGQAGVNSLSVSMYFDCIITSLATFISTEELVRFRYIGYANCSGEFRVYGGSAGTAYVDRRQWDGIVIEQCPRTRFPGLSSQSVKRNGITIHSSGNSNGARFPKLAADRSGGELPGTMLSGWTTIWATATDYPLNATVKNSAGRMYTCTTDPGVVNSTVEPVHTTGAVTDVDGYGWTYTGMNSGSVNSANQRTTLLVTDIPEALALGDFITYGGRPYHVMTVNIPAGTIDVFPWVINPVAGPIMYLVGAGAYFVGSDSNICQIGFVDTGFNGTGAKLRSLYAPTIEQMHTSQDGIGVAIGSATSGAWIGGFITNFYVENPTSRINFVECSDPNGAAFSIGTLGPGSLSQIFKPTANTGTAHAFRNLRTSILNTSGKAYLATNGTGGNISASSISPSNIPSTPSFFTRYADAQTVDIIWDEHSNRLFGMDVTYLYAFGSGVRKNPTGTWTFNPPAGWTIVGQSVFMGLPTPTLFAIHYMVTAQTVTVTKVSQAYNAVSADMGDATVTVFQHLHEPTLYYNTPLTSTRNVTLSSTGASNGAKFRVVRTAAATGSSNLNVGSGPLKGLTPGTWCDVEHNGTAWFLSAYGSLVDFTSTVVYNPPSLAAGAYDAVQTLALMGAVLGDIVRASFTVNLNGANLDCWVSAADVVSFRFSNPTTGVLDLASGTVKVRIVK